MKYLKKKEECDQCKLTMMVPRVFIFSLMSFYHFHQRLQEPSQLLLALHLLVY
jgi:hypothetical protein